MRWVLFAITPVIFLVTTAFPARAESGNGLIQRVRPTRVNTRTTAQQQKNETREQRRTQGKERAQKREELVDQRQQKREELREQRQARLEELKKQRAARRQELQKKRQEARERVKEKREEFKERLQKIRDERKQRVVERIAARMDTIQQNWVNRLTSHVDRLEEILDKIKTRTQIAKENGRDVAAVESAIVNAETGIAAARSAIATLAGKSYVIEISGESALGQDVSATKQALRSDLQTAHQTVKQARALLGEVLKALKNIPRINDLTTNGE